MLGLGFAQTVLDGVKHLLVEQGQLWGQYHHITAISVPSLVCACPPPQCTQGMLTAGCSSCTQRCCPHTLMAPVMPPREPTCSYLLLGEAVGEVHLGKQEGKEGFPIGSGGTVIVGSGEI